MKNRSYMKYAKAIFTMAAVVLLSYSGLAAAGAEKDSASTHCGQSIHDGHNMQGNHNLQDGQGHSGHDHAGHSAAQSKSRESIVREGVINLAAIDKNKDGKVFQDMMDWNVISDKPGQCPLCKMTLKEVSLKAAKENLVKHGFKVK